MKGHPDARVCFERHCQHSTSAFPIRESSAFHQHHCVEAAYLGLFEEVGKGLGLMQRRLKMIFSGSPLTCRCRANACDRMREAKDREQRYCSGVDQLANQRVKLCCSPKLAEDNE